jgi:hypothetical protein
MGEVLSKMSQKIEEDESDTGESGCTMGIINARK